MGFKGALLASRRWGSVSFSSQIWDLKEKFNWEEHSWAVGFSSQIWDLKFDDIIYNERSLEVLAAKYGI